MNDCLERRPLQHRPFFWPILLLSEASIAVNASMMVVAVNITTTHGLTHSCRGRRRSSIDRMELKKAREGIDGIKLTLIDIAK